MRLLSLSFVLVAGLASLISLQAQAEVRVRAGQHPDRERLVFDFPEKIDYDARVEGGSLVIRFASSEELNLEALVVEEPEFIGSPSTPIEDGKRVFRAPLSVPVKLSKFLDGTHIVIDLVRAELPKPQKPQELDEPQESPAPQNKPPLEAAPTPERPPAKQTEIAEALETVSPGVGTQEVSTDGEATEASPKAAPETSDETALASLAAPSEEAIPQMAALEPMAPAIPTPTTTETKAPELDQKPADAPILVDISRTREGVALSLHGTKEWRAAIFKRGEYVWAVLDGGGAATMSALPMEFRDSVSGMDEVHHSHARVLRFRVAPKLFPVARLFRDGWVIELKPYASAPLDPLQIRAQGALGLDARLFIPIRDPGAVMSIKDPAVGDTLAVIPALPSGRGLEMTRRYAEAELFASAQGLVVKPFTSLVNIRRLPKGVAITKSEGLQLSKLEGQILPDEDEEDVPGAQKFLNPLAPPVDFAAWRTVPREQYGEFHEGLIRDLATAEDEDRPKVRWKMARFYLGHKMVPEALAMMSLMERDDATLIEDTDFRVARGVANIFMRRYDKALDDLSHELLQFEPHSALWRSRAHLGMGHWEDAQKSFTEGSSVLPYYEGAVRSRFLLVGAEAALNSGDLGSVPVYLNMLAEMPLSEALAAEADYMQARLEEAKDVNAAALLSYERVVAADVRPVSSRAEFDLINLAYKVSKITREEAVDRLQRLRYLWRGDSLELAVLKRLGELNVENGDFREGLNTLRMAATYFSRQEAARGVLQEMEDIFRQLFLKGQADTLPALTSLALYYDFRELTPIGAEGDIMIRQLAQRLVGVDLLGRAEKLLEHQIEHRLEGIAKAQVATQLALIYLADKKPQEALDIVRTTTQRLMPVEMKAPRNQIMAQALMDLGRLAEAESSIIDDESHEATLLRSDIYWLQQDWGKVVSVAEKILGTRSQSGEPLGDEEGHQLLRMLVALSLMENTEAVRAVRKQYLPVVAGTRHEGGFDAITKEISASGLEIGQLVSEIADVRSFESVLADYRTRFSTNEALN